MPSLRSLSFWIVPLAFGIWIWQHRSQIPPYLNWASRTTISRRVHQRILRIEASDQLDATRALGYMHAKDRLLQLLLLKSVAAGNVSVWWVDLPATRALDVAMRQHNFPQTSDEAWELVLRDASSGDTAQLLRAYAQGINDYLETTWFLPLEFYLMGVKDPACLSWSPRDTFMTMQVMCSLGMTDLHSSLEKFLIEAVKQNVKIDHLKVLFSPYLDDWSDEMRSLLKQTHVAQSLMRDDQAFASREQGLGSNAFVVGGQHTQSGKPIVAFDPHLEISRLPAIWYQVQINDSKQTTFGITMPGVPFHIMGMNDHVAIGITYGFGDYFDYFVEDVRDGTYRVNETHWEPFRKERQDFITKAGAALTATTFWTARGIIELDHEQVLNQTTLSNGYYLSKKPALGAMQISQATLHMTQLVTATSALQAADHARHVCMPFNFILADVQGDIVYQQSGVHPNRPVSGLFPVPGWSEWVWEGYYAPHELVRNVNPPEGMLASANNHVTDMQYPSSPPHRSMNVHMGSYRRERILGLLQTSTRHTLDSMRQIQLDTAAPVALVDKIRLLLEQSSLKTLAQKSAAARLLLHWNGRFDSDSEGAVIFDRVHLGILEEAYAQVFGRDAWQKIQANTPLYNTFSYWFDQPVFFDEDDPLGVFGRESLAQIVERVLNQVIQEADAADSFVSWGAAKQYILKHLLFEEKFPFLQLGFSYGPMPMSGGLGVLVQGGIRKVNGLNRAMGVSWRFLWDLGNRTLATSLPGGPSGNRLDGSLYTTGIENHFANIYDYFDI